MYYWNIKVNKLLKDIQASLSLMLDPRNDYFLVEALDF